MCPWPFSLTGKWNVFPLDEFAVFTEDGRLFEVVEI